MLKKILVTVFALCVCLPLAFLLSSCSERKDTADATTEKITEETTYSTSGTYNETVNWRYDKSTSTFFIYGTGTISRDDGIIHCDESTWSKIAENIYLEEGITDVADHYFWHFDKVKTLFLPSTYTGGVPKIETVEKYAVAENNPKYSSDEYGVLFNPNKTEMIRFPKCSPLETYKIPDGVTTIHTSTFEGSKNLKTVIIPESLGAISRTAFENSSVYLNPENWENDAFYVDNCLVKVDWKTKAENIIIREGTRKIEAHAFSGCENIKSIIIPDSVEVIGAQAFESCSSLEHIYIGNGVKSIGVAPFVFDVEGQPCSNLKNIEVSKENKHYISVDGVLFNKEMTELIQYPIGKKQKEYVIPDSVINIGNGAFCYCDELTKLTVGKGITVIDYCLVFGCDNMETVVLPNTLTKLDGGAFKYSGIKYIDIPDSVTYLGCEAMTACPRLETVNIGKGVSYIHEWAIGGDSLKRINVNNKNEYFISDKGVLFNKDKTELWLYPENREGEEYHIPESVKTIKSGAIMRAKNLKKVYVGSSVEKIEYCNFYESVEDPELDFRLETNYEIYYDGTEKQWNNLFADEYEREHIDKTKVKYSL